MRGCSHIYSDKGEGLQYRLSKVEDPIMRGRNPLRSMADRIYRMNRICARRFPVTYSYSYSNS